MAVHTFDSMLCKLLLVRVVCISPEFLPVFSDVPRLPAADFPSCSSLANLLLLLFPVIYMLQIQLIVANFTY